MYALKDKLSNRVSRLFTDSPNSDSPSPRSPAVNSQARSSSEEETSVSSYLSLILTPLSFGRSRSNKQQNHLKSIQSPHGKRSGEDSKLQKDYLGNYPDSHSEEYQKTVEDGKECSPPCKNKQTPKIYDNNDEAASARSSSDSNEFEEACAQQTTLTPLSSENPLPYIMDDSTFISSELYEFFQSSLPNIVKGCQWVLLYSTLKHGISLRTLIRKTADHSGPCLLIVGDRQGAVFGGLLECPLKPTAKRKYQGTNQSFVFTTIYGEPRLFRPTGANRYYYLCLNDLLALGGGDNFALYLDGDLLNGTSGPCDTFGNLCLAHNPEFELKNVELWGFTHTSRYISWEAGTHH